ncbi:MAG: tRNA preQ1(34) S-adenosylmethionine ribosyltransferase-isomerase QueA [Terriglobia bacterium]
MRVDEFDFELPKSLIAQRPIEPRDASRMMLLDRARGTFADRMFRNLPQILRPGDLLVFNNTKVFPARLLGRRLGTTAQKIGRNNPAAHEFLTGEVELFLLQPLDGNVWEGLVHPGRKVRTGEIVMFGEGALQAEIIGRGERGIRRVRLQARDGSVEEVIDRIGHVPLPPYILRPDEVHDRETYQTVYAKVRGAVAAPTAGLHFTEHVLKELEAHGVETCEITLHVGLGTFQPVRVEQVEEHRMEPERFEVSTEAAAAINRALDENRRVIAVGTTSTRTLEHLACTGSRRIELGRGETNLFIVPGHEFRVVRGLLTNFHLPQSTLLMLVSAFAGRDLILRAYLHAVEQQYRFYSYGDCMLIA